MLTREDSSPLTTLRDVIEEELSAGEGSFPLPPPPPLPLEKLSPLPHHGSAQWLDHGHRQQSHRITSPDPCPVCQFLMPNASVRVACLCLSCLCPIWGEVAFWQHCMALFAGVPAGDPA